MPRAQRRTASPGAAGAPTIVTRVQTGVRIEKHILKVLKAIAEYHEITLGDVIEGIVLHAFEGRPPFEQEGLVRIREFRRIYGLDLSAVDAHHMVDAPVRSPARSTRRRRA